MYKIFNKNINFIFLIIFVLIPALYSETFLRFNYPHAITIKDEKILVIHEDGVTICDPTLKTILKEVVTFTDSEKINTDAKLSKVTTLYEMQYNAKYVVALINDYIYIFDNEGNLKLKSDNTIHYGYSYHGDYYTLSSLGYSENYFYFVIGFIYNKKLYLYAYKYNFAVNSITKYDELDGYTQQYNSGSSYYYIMNNALSCEYVYHPTLKDILLCTFLIYDYRYSATNIIAFVYLKIYTTYIQLATSSYNSYYQYNYNALCFKTSLNLDRNKIVIVGYCDDGLGIFTTYNVNTNQIIDKKYIVNHYIRKQYHNLQIRYFNRTNEIIMTGLLSSNDRNNDNILENDYVVIEFFDNTLNNYNYGWKYERSCSMKGYSILYLVHKSDYYIMSDIECSGIYYPLKLLMGEEPTVLTEAPVESTQVQVEQSTTVIVEDSPTIYVESTQVQEESSTAVVVEDSPTIYVESTQVQVEQSTTAIIEDSPTVYVESTQVQVEQSTTAIIEDSPTIYVESTQVQVEQSSTAIIEDSPTVYVESTQVQEEPSTTQLVEKSPTLYVESTQIQEDITTDIGTNGYNLEKCEICDETSFNQNLCIKCNKVKGFYFLNINLLSEAELSGEYIDCVNNENKPSNFYFNSENEDFRPCYETCATCDQGGTWDSNKCLTCKNNYIPKPDINPTSDCVLKCRYYYYYSSSNQYKCTQGFYCPLNYNLLIKDMFKRMPK